MMTRRNMLVSSLKSATLVAMGPTVPTFLADTARASVPQPDGRVLIVVQRDGGNDAINTLVPFGDEGYAFNRKALRLPEKALIPVNDHVGLHPALTGLGRLLEKGQLALVPGVGYPNPNRSHFESMSIWQTARLDLEEHSGPGWIGRSFDARAQTENDAGASDAMSVFVGGGATPAALRGRRAGAASLERIEDLMLPTGWETSMPAIPLEGKAAAIDGLSAYVRRSVVDAYSYSRRVAELTGRGAVLAPSYPDTGLAGKLRTIAQLLKVDLGARVYYTPNRATIPTPASRIRMVSC
jgi:uncharacterized protein (DUF1501 family)